MGFTIFMHLYLFSSCGYYFLFYIFLGEINLNLVRGSFQFFLEIKFN